MNDNADARERFLTLKQVTARTTYSRAKLYTLFESNKFPKPIKLDGGRIVFLESEIDAYIATTIQKARGEAA
ncbi:AlpA family phage regulatory protein [Rhizobium sp. BG4]|uniref:helix-turn-helix transcriptional regulator n=1 Tax=Rhizobium sp. BG4 TaxID=2613770 RepID=UPI00193CDDA9|nr:AlpA family phage regulatory protein [Rhizobium sp. BG4]